MFAMHEIPARLLATPASEPNVFYVEADPEAVRHRRMRGYTRAVQLLIKDIHEANDRELDALAWPLLGSAREVAVAYLEDLGGMPAIDVDSEADPRAAWMHVRTRVGDRFPGLLQPEWHDSVIELLALCAAVNLPPTERVDVYLDVVTVTALVDLAVRDLDGITTGIHEHLQTEAEIQEHYSNLH